MYDFLEAILLAFDQPKRTAIRFGQAWKVCETAAPHLKRRPLADPKGADRDGFVRRLLDEMTALSNLGLVELSYHPESQNRISFLNITVKGRQLIESWKEKERADATLVVPPGDRTPETHTW